MPRAIRLPLLPCTLLLAACGSDGGTTPPGDTTHPVSVQVVTTGDDVDPDGYALHLGSRSQPVQTSGSVTFEDISPGTHQVRITGVAANCSVEGGDTRTVTVGPDSGATTRFDVVCERDFHDGFATVACPALSVPVEALEPFDQVEIGSLPSALGDTVWARTSWDGGPEWGLGRVVVDASGAASLSVPVHPSGTIGGGPAWLRLADGASACPGVEIEIAALEPVPGATHGLVDAVEGLLATHAAELGTSRDQLLAAEPSEIPDHLQPLAIAFDILGGPTHPSSVRAMLDALDAESLTRLDAAVGASGAVDLFPSPSDADRPGASNLLQPGLEGLPCQSFKLGEAQKLSTCMIRALEAEVALFTVDRPELPDLLVQAAHLLGDGEAIVAAANTAIDIALVGAFAILPSRFVDGGIELSRYEWDEDDERIGTWDAGWVRAGSIGFEIPSDVQEVVGAFLDGPVLGYFEKAGFDIGSLLPPLAGAVFSELHERVRSENGARWPAKTFEPVDVRSDEWTTTESGGNVIFQSLTEFTIFNPGRNEFTMEPKPVRFGGESIEVSVDIDVKEIEVEIIPAEIWLQPNEVHQFEVEVRNSRHPGMVEFYNENFRQGEAVLEVREPQPHLILYRAPGQPEFNREDALWVKSTSTTGARRTPPARETRRGLSFIYFADVTIESPTTCLEPGQDVTLTATVEAELLEDESVGWAVETGPGEIDDEGRYVAPEGASGSVTIRAFLVAQPGIEDTITLQIGGCTCSFTLSVNGAMVEGAPGDRVAFTDHPPSAGGNHQLVSVHIEKGGEETVIYPTDGGFITGPEELPLGPGVYPGVAGGGVGFAGSYGSYGNVGVFELLEYEPEQTEEKGRKARGTMAGTVLELGNTENAMLLEVEFSISLPPDYTVLGARYTCVIPESGGP